MYRFAPKVFERTDQVPEKEKEKSTKMLTSLLVFGAPLVAEKKCEANMLTLRSVLSFFNLNKEKISWQK